MSLSNERSTLAADPSVANDSRARGLILDPNVKIEDARGLVAMARRVVAAGRGPQALDSSNKAQAMSLKSGSSHVVDGGVIFDSVRQVQVLGAPVVVVRS
jgi:hypothetical protein